MDTGAEATTFARESFRGRGSVKHNHNRCFTGGEVCARKSATQKALRRRDATSAVGHWLAMVGPALARDPAEAPASAAAVISNAVNRLGVIAVEDVQDSTALPAVYALLAKAKSTLVNPDACVEDVLRGLSLVCGVIEYLAAAPHLRLLSHLKTVCHLPPMYVPTTTTRGHDVYLDGMANVRWLVDLPPNHARGLVLAPGPEAALVHFESALDVLVECRRRVKAPAALDFASACLRDALVEVFDVVGVVMRHEDGAMFASSAGRTALFRKVQDRCTNDDERACVEVFRTCAHAMTHKERLLYLYQAVVLVGTGVLGGALETARAQVEVYTRKWGPDRVRALFVGGPAAFPDVLPSDLDLHTRQGRASGNSSRLVFAVVGAAVADELPHCPAMERAYVFTKALLDLGWMATTAPCVAAMSRGLVAMFEAVDVDPVSVLDALETTVGRPAKLAKSPKPRGRDDPVQHVVECTPRTDVPLLSQLEFTSVQPSAAYMAQVAALCEDILRWFQGPGRRETCSSGVAAPAPFGVAQTVTTAGKALTVLTPTLVMKGPMHPATAALVERRCAVFRQATWAPECHLQWRTYNDPAGNMWLYTPNADQKGRLPGVFTWERVYSYTKPSAHMAKWLSVPRGEPVTLWAWKARRGSLPADSTANRVKDHLDAGGVLDHATYQRLFTHLALRFVLGCGDAGFHNCLMGGWGADFEDNRRLDVTYDTVLRALAPSGKVGRVGRELQAVQAALEVAADHVHTVLEALNVAGLSEVECGRRRLLIELFKKRALS